MSIDHFETVAPGLQSPAIGLEEITPNDGVDLVNLTRALNVAQSGAVRVMTIDGNTSDVFIAAGVAFPIRVQRVFATGTSALGIRGLY